uniref:VQ domain-containing protein n=1 Tax=Kalanchoe fedtschenkoi TaxID=63787 RepID=A0A7N1A9B1_KALFE
MMSSFRPSDGHRHGDQLKVTFIETQYIQTDAISFKSVVQSLTGKDSSCNLSRLKEAAQNSPPSKPAVPKDFSWPSVLYSELPEDFRSGAGTGASVLDKQSSFRDFERMISQLPPVEDIFHFLDNL